MPATKPDSGNAKKPSPTKPTAARKASGAGVAVAPPTKKPQKRLEASHAETHGFAGDKTWAAPVMVRECDTEARPGYKSCKAHEYLEEPDVLLAKVRLLAAMLKRSTNCVAYTGAGISTASGINDYASKASGSVALDRAKVSAGDAQPTLAHRCMVGLHRKGLLKYWVQQNHDGLPQKAGLPQQCINEIHGAWFDPSNPVVPMSGTLRGDLMEDLEIWENKADMCLAMGTSMCGMNADRMATTCAAKAMQGEGIGTVIVALQATQYDNLCSLRIFAKIDDVMALLAKELSLEVAPPGPYRPPAVLPMAEVQADIYENLPYDAKGNFDPNARMRLDLRRGAKLHLVRQPKWDYKRLDNSKEGKCLGKTPDGHYQIRVGVKMRKMGLWWLAAAKEGAVPTLPVINVA